uniref:Uncharacterized protein n=1 Tax=Rhizophora mucronata TaxID=61149 RepID=A0A2P2ISU3_RHIMU
MSLLSHLLLLLSRGETL